MNDKNKHKENINPMDRDSDGLITTERQILETFKVFEDKLRDVTPEVLATLVLAETIKGLTFTAHKINQQLTRINDKFECLSETLNLFEGLNCDEPSRSNYLDKALRFLNLGIKVLSLVCGLIGVVKCFM